MRLKFVRFLLFVVFCFFCFCGYSDGTSRKVINNSNNFNHSNVGVNINTVSEVNEGAHSVREKYLATINVSKIGLNRPLYSLNSKLNTVDKNIEVLKSSDMPDVENGNFILAAHNGYSPISYFHNLHKLEVDDEVNVNYNRKIYTYRVSKIYDVIKTGKVSIKRDKSKTTITMITCKGDDKQLVVIGYLI